MEALYYAGDYCSAEAVAAQLADVGTRFDLPDLIGSAFIGRSFIAVWRGDADDAEQCFSFATDHFGGTSSFDSYGSMFVPAFIALLRGDLDEAESLFLEALRIDRNLRGERHPHVATVLGNFAALFAKRGDYARAEELHRDALSIRREAFDEIGRAHV